MKNKEKVLKKYPSAFCIEYWITEEDYFDKDLECTIYGRGTMKRYKIQKYPWSGYVIEKPNDLDLSNGYETPEQAWADAAKGL